MKKLLALTFGITVGMPIVLIAILLAGCDTMPASTEVIVPSANGGQPITYRQSGNAENPSTLTVADAPVGYWLEGEAGKGKPDLSFPSSPKSSGGRIVTITGPKTYPPPAPPSPAEKAEGNAVYIAIGCVLVGIIAAGALAKFGFVHEAFWAVAGGFACGAAVRFISNEVAMYVAGAIALLIGVLVWAWYRVRDRVPEEYGGRLKPAKK